MEAGAAGLVIGKSYIQPSFLCIRQETRFVLICVYQICGIKYAVSDMRYAGNEISQKRRDSYE